MMADDAKWADCMSFQMELTIFTPYTGVFDPLDLCQDAICKPHSQCSNIDGKCHCHHGYVVEKDECVYDESCRDVPCLSGALCRFGKCSCRIGHIELVSGECVQGTFGPCRLTDNVYPIRCLVLSLDRCLQPLPLY